jgi:hypothetical protein
VMGWRGIRMGALAAVCAAVVACDEPARGPAAGAGGEPPRGGGAAPDPAVSEPGATAATVEVWFERGGSPTSVPRRVGGVPLDGALRALVQGPTAEERAAGVSSWFSDSTAEVVRRVRYDSAHVTVDFRDLSDRIPGASSSAGSEALLSSLDSTVFQFPWVETVEYQLEGSCEAFWEWIQRECEVVRRP